MKADGLFADALFLDRHPGWTWADLQDTPDFVVETLRMIDVERARE